MASHPKSGMTQTAKVSSWRRISEDAMPPRIENLSNFVALTYCIPTAIFAEAALSFDSAGIRPPQPNW
jgi:ABC-type dipeptide/oligopeptide/nickel transport system permease subunit